MNTIVKTIFKIIIPTIMVLTSFNINAVELVAKGGLQSGGNTLVSLKSIEPQVYNLNAGGGFFLALGINTRSIDGRNLRITLGYLTDNITGTEIISNTAFEYAWSHIPLDFLIYEETEEWIYGAGLTAHINPELKATGFFAGKGIKYDDALGLIGELDYRIQKDFFIGVNLTLISYKGNDGKTISGSSIGLNVGLTFGEL